MRTLLAIILILTLTGLAEAQRGQNVQPTQSWNGSVDDLDKMKLASSDPITDARTFEKIWKEWKVGDKVPSIDFSKQFVMVVTGRGSRLNLTASLMDDNLRVLGLGTRDLRPGFRYVIAVFDRASIKKVNNKDLPKGEKPPCE